MSVRCVDPLFALVDFFMVQTGSNEPPAAATATVSEPVRAPNTQTRGLEFRVDLHEVSVSVLENDSDAESQAIRLTIQQISMAQQVSIALFL